MSKISIQSETKSDTAQLPALIGVNFKMLKENFLRASRIQIELEQKGISSSKGALYEVIFEAGLVDFEAQLKIKHNKE